MRPVAGVSEAVQGRPAGAPGFAALNPLREERIAILAEQEPVQRAESLWVGTTRAMAPPHSLTPHRLELLRLPQHASLPFNSSGSSEQHRPI